MGRREKRKKGQKESYKKLIYKKTALLLLIFFPLLLSFLPLFIRMKNKAAADSDYVIINDYILRCQQRKEEGSNILSESIKTEYSLSIKKEEKGSLTVNANTMENFMLFNEIMEKYSGQEILGLIRIPAIDCRYPVLEGAEETQLSVAVGHLPGSAGIGKEGNCVIAGHSGSPDGDFFNCLKKLCCGDSVFILRADGESFAYQVEDMYTVSPDETECLDGGLDYELTLVTCAKGGEKRLICRCIPIDS